MDAHLRRIYLEDADAEDDVRREYLLERFLRSRDVLYGKPPAHRTPLVSVQTALILEVAGPRRRWDERLLRNAWRCAMAVEPIRSGLGDIALRRAARHRWPGHAASPWLCRPLVDLRQRMCEDAKRYPDAYGPASRAFMEYVLLALLTATA